ncbi:unnamed protein product [Prorocentrum cordatum]|uniref:Xrn1 N-terminal domain-containing protein n=1 Tax=Prorocentrum cordatum TaxID=2364126 RepID=A0ABN9PK69_9DINO|nr:unnamed protein product [Polarella glacialis]
MGIQGLQRWIAESFPEAFSSQVSLEADHVYVDMNTILHQILEGAGGSGADEGQFMSALEARLDQILARAVPRASVFLAVDGPAATAKVAEQRRRRRQRCSRLAVASGPRRGGGRGRGGAGVAGAAAPGRVSANMLTPGVPFMERLSAGLRAYCEARLGLAPGPGGAAPSRWPEGARAAVSGASSAGEGEHKILAALLRNARGSRGGGAAAAGSQGPPRVHVVIGGDVDLLLQPLAPRGLLEGSQVLIAAPPRGLAGPPMRVCDVGRLGAGICERWRRALDLSQRAALEEAPPPGGLADALELGVRRDFVLVALMRGNDYLPPLSSSQDPARLWAAYLRWRRGREQGAGGLVGVEVDEQAGRLALCLGPVADFMASCSGCPPPAPLGGPLGGGDEEAEGVAAYLSGLLWCMETYVHGRTPDFHFLASAFRAPCPHTRAPG